MSVVIETTLGDITVDLFLQQRPVTCLNFLKLCKMKYYNFNLFHSIRSGFIAQTGDPTGEGTGGESIFGILEGSEKRYFSGEKLPKIRHTNTGTLSMVCTGENMVGSQFFFTLAPDLDSLDSLHCVIGEVTEGYEVLRKLNDVICDEGHRPYRDVRITHTVVLEDPYNDPPSFRAPSRSPSPSAERLKGGRIAPDEDIDETHGKSAEEIQEMIEDKEAKARATILEIVGDLPDADIAPPENVLFVCKLNPVTTDEDLEIIFSRFGKIVSCEVIRDKKTGDSLQYAFIEFDNKKSCEDAYFKMDNVLIDDRRIHVDFSQSVSRMKWLGKGRGVKYFNDDDKDAVRVNKHRDDYRDQRNGKLENHSNKHRDHEQARSRDRHSDRRHRDEQERHHKDRIKTKQVEPRETSRGHRDRKSRSRSHTRQSYSSSRRHYSDRDGHERKRRSNSRDNSNRVDYKIRSRTGRENSPKDRRRDSKREKSMEMASRSQKERSSSRSKDESFKKHKSSTKQEENNRNDVRHRNDSKSTKKASNKNRSPNPSIDKSKIFSREHKHNSKKRDKSRSQSLEKTLYDDNRNEQGNIASRWDRSESSDRPAETVHEESNDITQRNVSRYIHSPSTEKDKRTIRSVSVENKESKDEKHHDKQYNDNDLSKGRIPVHHEKNTIESIDKNSLLRQEHRNEKHRETTTVEKRVKRDRSFTSGCEYDHKEENTTKTHKNKSQKRMQRSVSPSFQNPREDHKQNINVSVSKETISKYNNESENDNDAKKKSRRESNKSQTRENLSPVRGSIKSKHTSHKQHEGKSKTSKSSDVEDISDSKVIDKEEIVKEGKTENSNKKLKNLDKSTGKNQNNITKKKKAVKTKKEKIIGKKKRKHSTSSSESDSSESDSSTSSTSSSDNKKKKAVKRRKKKVSTSSSSSSSSSTSSSSSSSSSDSSSSTSSSDSEPSKKRRKKVISSKVKNKKERKKRS